MTDEARIAQLEHRIDELEKRLSDLENPHGWSPSFKNGIVDAVKRAADSRARRR